MGNSELEEIGRKSLERRRLAQALLRYVGVVGLAMWLGGLTIYSWVVIPAGAAVVGGTTQGFVTQRVTVTLNWIAVLMLLALLPSLGRRWMWLSWGTMALTLAGLFMIHARVDASMNSGSLEILNYEDFYFWHKTYLIVTTVQGLAGLWHLWGMVRVREVGRELAN